MKSTTFAELGVSEAVRGALTRRGITSPFTVQRLVIADVLSGRDVLVKSPTGSGKTLAFAIPLVDRIEASGPRPAALVLAPTRELVVQIADELRAIGHARALRVSAIYGGVGIAKQAAATRQSHILVATPGRLEDLLQRGAFTLDAIRVLVLDEADRMLDMGFRPAVDRIVRRCPRERQTIFLSATLDGIAGKVASTYTTEPVVHDHSPHGQRTAAGIEHRFVAVTGDRVETLVVELARDRDLALVFVRTKRGADRLVKRLASHGVTATAIHGNKSQRQRELALTRFERREIDTLIATDIAARGIDVQGISHVINYDPPDDHDTYTHRVGRTGRAGRTGTGVTLIAPAEQHHARQLAKRLGITTHSSPPTRLTGGNSPAKPRRAPNRAAHRPSRRRQPPNNATGLRSKPAGR
jgi:superfamily II DNA/RNA helicase